MESRAGGSPEDGGQFGRDSLLGFVDTDVCVAYKPMIGAVIAPRLIEDGFYDYPYMGAAFEDEISLDEQSIFGLSQTAGAYVVSVTEDSPADRAGLRAASSTTGRGGDLIIAIDGKSINDFGDLNGYLVFETEVGQTIAIRVLRDGRPVELSLTLGERP